MNALEYTEAVLTKKIVASRFVIKACRRFKADLKRKDFEYKPEKAAAVIDFYENTLCHWEGSLVGQPIKLAGFQQFILSNIYGFYKDGLIRFNTGYIQTGKKNAKTILVGGMGLFDIIAGDELTPQIFVGANNEEQAKICTQSMGMLCRISPGLKELISDGILSLHTRVEKVYALTIKNGHRFGTVRSMSRDFLTKDGLNPSKVIIDEYMNAVSDDLKNVAETGSVQRENPQCIVITTPGYNKSGVCYTKDRAISVKILNGVLKDDHHFAFIAEPDSKKKAEKGDLKEWVKGNPLMYHEEYNDCENTSKIMAVNLRKAWQKAVNEGGSRLVDFQIKNLGLWLDSSTTWIPSDIFSKNHNSKYKIADLKGKESYGGLDLSSDDDLTAFARFYPNAFGVGKHAMTFKVWIPEDTANRKADYFNFEKLGLITRTPGNMLNSSRIFREIADEVEGGGFKFLCYDRMLSTSIDQLADEGVGILKMGQGFFGMDQPMRMMFRLFMDKKGESVEHFNNILLGWCISNVVVSTDGDGRIKPDKKKSFEKIDLAVAGIMSVNAWMMKDEYQTEPEPFVLIGN